HCNRKETVVSTNIFDDLEIEALSDDALEMVSGGKSSDGPQCCSCSTCSDNDGDKDDDITIEVDPPTIGGGG
ncbi:MAG: hypothetical protein AAFX50_24905, partial [Acidobacteriota bacterium]